MKSWISGLALCAVIALGALAPLELRSEPAKIAESADSLDDWRARVREARERVRDAHTELAAAEYAYADWRQRKLPRGKPKGEIVARIDRAEQEVAAAEAALPGVVDEARGAGLQPGDFRALDVEP
jgi:hypothetical protein